MITLGNNNYDINNDENEDNEANSRVHDSECGGH
jgi:hypothetical protein